MIKKLDKISSKVEFQNPFWTYKIDEYSYPNGKIGKYYYVETLGSTFVIPKNSDGKYILTKQYRYLNQRESIEFPGGGLRQNATFLENAVSELEEESGFSSKNIDFIGEFNPYNGVTNEICKVYFASDIFEVVSECDESEEFELLFLNAEEIDTKISSGEIWDGMTLAAWSLFTRSNYYHK